MKYFLLIISITLMLIIAPPLASAEQDISVLDSTTEIHFPTALVFMVKAESSSDITRIRLSYQVEKMNFAKVISEAWPEFTPSNQVEARWTWDMRNASLPPSAIIHYWWTIENKNGSKFSTPISTVRFSDNRYNWKDLSSGKVTLFYYESNQSFADELMEATQQALERLATDTGVSLEQPIELYIYANSKDLQGSMVFPREWTGGTAFTQYNIIAIGISPQNLDWGKKALAHELGHIVTHQLTYSPYGANLPTWLDEGLAMHAEGQLDLNLELYLKKAAIQQSLISIRSLSSPFSAKSEDAYLSYAESQSVIEYLLQNYSKDKMAALLNFLKDGTSVDEALSRLYGFDQDGLEQSWHASLSTTLPKQTTERRTQIAMQQGFSTIPIFAAVVLVILGISALTFYLVIWSRRRNKRIHSG
jgi:hypothetical protein